MDRSPDQRPERPVGPDAIRVLFVDDEPALARLASRALPLSGIAADVFTDPEAAAAAYEADPSAYDVLVTDHAMGALSGLQLVARLRRTSPSLPTILTSGYLNAAQRAEATELGIDEFLQKPATIADLVSAVRSLGRREQS